MWVEVLAGQTRPAILRCNWATAAIAACRNAVTPCSFACFACGFPSENDGNFLIFKTSMPKRFLFQRSLDSILLSPFSRLFAYALKRSHIMAQPCFDRREPRRGGRPSPLKMGDR